MVHDYTKRTGTQPQPPSQARHPHFISKYFQAWEETRVAGTCWYFLFSIYLFYFGIFWFSWALVEFLYFYDRFEFFWAIQKNSINFFIVKMLA